MPANPKYLTKSPWLRLVKILVGFGSGYAVMLSLHLLLMRVFPPQNVVATAFITGYVLWALLLLWAFVARNVWRVGATYLGLTLLFSLPTILA
jgi:hypothetical protein